MDLDLRPVRTEEMPAFQRATAIAFGSLPSDDDLGEWGGGLEAGRTLAAFDGDAIVATAGALSFELTVPGLVTVPAAGVTMVGVHPTHRRRGLLRDMMRRQLDDVVARGEPLAVLIASESSIYSRFGYGLATFLTTWTLPADRVAFTVPVRSAGRIRLLGFEEALAVVPGVYDAARRRHVGEVTRHEEVWRHTFAASGGRRDRRPPFAAVHESDDGVADGFALYRVKDDWSGGIAANTVEVHDLYALDDEIEAALWQFLVDIDLVATVKAFGRPVDEPLRFRLEDPRRMQVTQLTDHLWVRVVDPVAALTARSYSDVGQLVVDLDDRFLPANSGRWHLGADSDKVDVSRTDDAPDLAMGAPALGSLYLGGVTARSLARAGRIRELAPGAVERADRLFGITPTPWCRTDF